MPLEVTVRHVSGSKKDEVEVFTKLPLTFGRSRECDVRFDPERESLVSGVHAELRAGADGILEIVDRESKNGVLLNGIKVEGSAQVPEDSTLELGPGGPRMRFSFGEAAGVSFARVRKTTKLAKNRPPERLAATAEALPTYDEADLLEERPKQPSLLENKALVVGLLVAAVALGLLGVAVAIFSS